MRVGIAGLGVVGGSLKGWIKANTSHEVVAWDPPMGLQDDFAGVSAVFVCVPAETRKDRSQDLTHVRDVLSRFQGLNVPFFIRTTVLPGTCDRLAEEFSVRVHACPEFLTERQAAYDVKKQTIICGHNNYEDTDLLYSIFPGKKPSLMANVDAELAKYAHNCAGAIKVNFFNQVRAAADELGADFDRVLCGVFMSGYIDPTHTMVPGPDGRRGFGGKCFPKDLDAFIGLLQELEVPCGSLVNASSENLIFREHGNGFKGLTGSASLTPLTYEGARFDTAERGGVQ